MKTVGFQGRIGRDDERTQRIPLRISNPLSFGVALEVSQGPVVRRDYTGNEENCTQHTRTVWIGDTTLGLRYQPRAHTLQRSSQVCAWTVGEGVQEHNRSGIVSSFPRNKEGSMGRGVLDGWILRGNGRRVRELGNSGEIHQGTRQNSAGSATTPLVERIHTLRSCRRVVDSREIFLTDSVLIFSRIYFLCSELIFIIKYL